MQPGRFQQDPNFPPMPPGPGNFGGQDPSFGGPQGPGNFIGGPDMGGPPMPPQSNFFTDEETIRLEVPANVKDQAFMDGGVWVRNVEQKSGARIVIRNFGDGSGCFLEMSGQPEQVVEAEQLAESTLRSFSAPQPFAAPQPCGAPQACGAPHAPQSFGAPQTAPFGAEAPMPPMPPPAATSSFILPRPRGPMPGSCPSPPAMVQAPPPVQFQAPGGACGGPCNGGQPMRPPMAPEQNQNFGGQDFGNAQGGCWPPQDDFQPPVPAAGQPPDFGGVQNDWGCGGGQVPEWGAGACGQGQDWGGAGGGCQGQDWGSANAGQPQDWGRANAGQAQDWGGANAGQAQEWSGGGQASEWGGGGGCQEPQWGGGCAGQEPQWSGGCAGQNQGADWGAQAPGGYGAPPWRQQ